MAAMIRAPHQTRHAYHTPPTDDESTLDVELLEPEERTDTADRDAARCAALAPDVPRTFARVHDVDAFSRARVVNFLKRHSKHASPVGQAERFETEALEPSYAGAAARFHCRLWLPLTMPSVAGDESAPGLGLWAHGVAPDRKQAELVAAMHAEYVIDALGHHIYTLPSMQRKHADAAHKAGRPAPMPDGGRGQDADVLPLPLELAVETDETEDGEWQLVDIQRSARYAALSPPHTLLSAAVFDPAAQRRLEGFLRSLGHSFAQNCVVHRTPPRNVASLSRAPEPAYFTAALRIPAEPLAADAPLVAMGKALKREDAMVLAAMHAELLLDTLNIPIFPEHPHRQKAHAQAAWSFGRPAPLPEATAKPVAHVSLPSPLKQLVLSEVNLSGAAGGESDDGTATTPPPQSQRLSPRSAEEELVHRHDVLSAQTTTFVDTTVKESTSVAQVKRYLADCGAPRAADPFFRESILGRVKSSVVLPVPSLYGVCGGVGLAPTVAEADVLAAMHALDTLCALVPVATGGVPAVGPVGDEAWRQRRQALLASGSLSSDAAAAAAAAAAGPDPSLLYSRPPGRRLAPGGFVRTVALTDVDDTATASHATAQGTAVEAPPAPASKPRRVVAKRAKTAAAAAEAGEPAAQSTSTPELTPDTADGFIRVCEEEDSAGLESTAPRSGDAIHSPRVLDPLAKTRVSEYLSSVGRRFTDVFTTRQRTDDAEDADTPLYECTAIVPVPPLCGDRLALGVAPTRTGAELLAAMHMELILDALGIALFTDAAKQTAHSLACERVGRWAVSGHASAPRPPPDTPSPPPLRLARAKSESGLDGHNNIHGDPTRSAETFATVRRSAAPTTSGTFTEVTEAALDTVSKTRVQYYLARQESAWPTVTFGMHMARGVLLHTASWALPLPLAGQATADTVTVSGTAPTKRDADTLSWMHAERVLHSLGVPLFDNLPRYQAWHAQRLHAAHAGIALLSAPTLSSSTPPAPYRLVAHVAPVSLPVPTVPPTVTVTDPSTAAGVDAAWAAYVEACTLYVSQKALAEANVFFDAGRVPRGGLPLSDATLTEVEARPLDPHAKLLLTLYAQAAQLELPRHWQCVTAGPLAHRVSYATLPVPGCPAATAQGVGPNKDTAQKRAAMHAMALLRVLDPNFAEHSAAAEEAKRAGLANAAGTGDVAAALASSQSDLLEALRQDADALHGEPGTTHSPLLRRRRHPGQRAKREGHESVEGLSSVKRRAVELYTLCAGLPPPQVTHLVEVTPSTAVHTDATQPAPPPSPPCYTAIVSVERGDNVDDARTTGPAHAVPKLWSAEATGGGPRVNEQLAFARLDELLRREDASLMDAVTARLHRSPSLDPSRLPALHLTEAQRETVAHLVASAKQAAAQRALVESRASAGSATEPTDHTPAAEERGKEDEDTHQLRTALEMTQAQQDLESAALQEQYLQKIMSPAYTSQYASRREALSIAPHRAQILQLIENNPVVIICGTTGCGKTTQVPQYILDSLTERGEAGGCSIVVTQPRRISALSIAARVAAERLESVGDNCGYVIRFDSQPGRHINFCTSGVIMRLLSSTPDLAGIKYLIIDEIHERDLISDFLLVVLRDLLTRRTDLRVILMSATLQAEQFGTYFRGAPIVNVEGYAHPVQELYLEDVADLVDASGTATPLAREALRAHQRQKRQRDLLSASAGDDDDDDAHHAKTATGFGASLGNELGTSAERQKYAVVEATSEIDYVIVQCAVEQGIRMVENIQESSVLVFLPGWEEIHKAKEIMERDARYQIIPLHSSVSPSDQMRCFLPAEDGKIKVVLATNIAESGITIDDVAVVVDLGRVKEKTYVRLDRLQRDNRLVNAADDNDEDHLHASSSSARDGGTGAEASRLMTVYASRANCIQRRGRVGRTRAGVCIRLFSREHFARLHEFQTPEMQRTPLDALCLRVLALRLPEPVTFLSGAMEPPERSAIEAAMARLAALGAITASSGALTPLGTRLAHLPLDPPLGKLVLLGVAFRCLDAALTLAAVAQTDIFKPGREHRASVRLYREDFSRDTLSDDIAALNAYNYWVAVHHANTPAEAAAQLNARMLSTSQLANVSRQKHQFFSILHRTHVLSPHVLEEGNALGGFGRHAVLFADTSSYSEKSLDVALVTSILAATFSPRVAIHTGAKTFRTQHSARAMASSDSVLAKTPDEAVKAPYFVYREAFEASVGRRLTIQGLSAVSIWSLILFASPETPLVRDPRTGLTTLDGWLLVHTSRSTFDSLVTLRATLADALGAFYKDPHDVANADLLAETWLLIGTLVRAPLKPNRLSDTTWESSGVIMPLAAVPESNATASQ